MALLRRGAQSPGDAHPSRLRDDCERGSSPRPSLHAEMGVASARSRRRLRRGLGRTLLRGAKSSRDFQAPSLVAHGRLQDARSDARGQDERRGRARAERASGVFCVRAALTSLIRVRDSEQYRSEKDEGYDPIDKLERRQIVQKDFEGSYSEQTQA